MGSGNTLYSADPDVGQSSQPYALPHRSISFCSP